MFRDARVERVVIATGRTDFRRGIDGLIALIRLNYGMDSMNGTLFLFCGTKRDRIKALI
jgi:transposase